MNYNVFRSMSYGVYIVSTMDNDRATGFLANSCMQITSEPPTIAVSVNHNNYTNDCIEKSGKFSISILAEDSDSALIGTFGFQSGKEIDKFTDVNYELVSGVPVVKNTCGYLVCKVIDKMETDTHTVFLGEVVEAEVYEGVGNPMTYAYYHNVVKGKSPKSAPTYIPEDTDYTPKEETKKYICEICGYVYEGDSLPEDYICPICGKGVDKFKEL